MDFYTLNNIRVNKVYHYHCLQTKQSLCSMYNKQKALQKKLSHWVRFFVVWVMDERFILKPTSVKIFFCSRGSKLRGNFDANFKIHLNAGTFNYIKLLFKSKTICSLSSKIQTKMVFFFEIGLYFPFLVWLSWSVKSKLASSLPYVLKG